MIAGTGWVASFREEIADKDGKKSYYWTRTPVVFFDEDGVGYVSPADLGVGDETRLRAASSWSNFPWIRGGHSAGCYLSG